MKQKNPRKRIDLVGQKFGRLTVIKRMGNDKYRNSRWLCLCECGKEKIIRGSHLKSGDIKSCGCLQKEELIKRSTTHGHKSEGRVPKTYMAWCNMIQRCTNSKHKHYQDYGGRGIKVCKRWIKFENFLEDMGIPKKGLTLDRIDNSKGYCKSNCRWATRKEQQRNTRRNHMISYNGKTQCMSEWAEQTGISASAILWRLNHGWSIEKALTTPVKKYKKRSA